VLPPAERSGIVPMRKATRETARLRRGIEPEAMGVHAIVVHGQQA
jgi:hypothetical protein